MPKTNDIKVPDGYFSSLESRLSMIPEGGETASPRPRPLPSRLAPYIAYAASLLALVTFGNYVLKKTAAPGGSEDTAEQSFYLSSMARYAVPEYDFMEADDAVSDDDIVKYLIAGGTSLRQIEYYLAYEQNR